MSQNQGTSFENDLGTFGIRTLNFGVRLETLSRDFITWNMVEFSMVLCCHHMKGRCFFTDLEPQNINSLCYDQPGGHGDVFSTHGVICIGCWHGLAVSLGSSVFLRHDDMQGLLPDIDRKTMENSQIRWSDHSIVEKWMKRAPIHYPVGFTERHCLEGSGRKNTEWVEKSMDTTCVSR